MGRLPFMKNPRRNKFVQGSGFRVQGNCPQPRAQNPEHGFSLIELLMASVIMAAAGALLMGGLVAANRGADRRIEQSLMTQTLANRLALLDDQPASINVVHGTDETPLGSIAWEVQWHDMSGVPLTEATVTVTHNDRTTRLVTYRALPAP